MPQIRVLIVDDRPAMRGGLRMMLSNHPDILVLAERASILSAIEQPLPLSPDVIVLGGSMLCPSPFTAALRFRDRFPRAKLLFLVDRDRLNVPESMPLGGDGYLASSVPEWQLVQTVLAVCNGQRVLDRDCAGLVLREYETARRELLKEKQGLSDQDVELLRMLSAGATNREIATRVYMSEITVARRIQRIVSKLQVANRTQAVAEAIRKGII